MIYTRAYRAEITAAARQRCTDQGINAEQCAPPSAGWGCTDEILKDMGLPLTLQWSLSGMEVFSSGLRNLTSVVALPEYSQTPFDELYDGGRSIELLAREPLRAETCSVPGLEEWEEEAA